MSEQKSGENFGKRFIENSTWFAPAHFLSWKFVMYDVEVHIWETYSLGPSFSIFLGHRIFASQNVLTFGGESAFRYTLKALPRKQSVFMRFLSRRCVFNIQKTLSVVDSAVNFWNGCVLFFQFIQSFVLLSMSFLWGKEYGSTTATKNRPRRVFQVADGVGVIWEIDSQLVCAGQAKLALHAALFALSSPTRLWKSAAILALDCDVNLTHD